MALDIGIKLNLEGYDGVMADLQKLDNYVKSHNRTELQLGLDKAKREVMGYRAEVAKLSSELAKMGKEDAGWESKNRELQTARANLKQASMAVSEFSYALSKMKKQLTIGEAFKKWSTNVAHLGSALQSAGNALVRFGSPFKQLTSGLVMGAGYKLLGKVTEGFESAFDRADTMRKYTRLMEEYSKKSYTAQDSIDALDKSVQGLPIALDDAVSLAQRYTLSLGDMERGTNLAIATNNAFLASMATESQRYQGMMQMQDLLNGKDLNSREWMSLGASMGKAVNEIGKEMGYGKDQMGAFRAELYAGNIATEDFLNALEKVGTGEGSLAKLALESIDTWEAFFSRIKTAFSRLGYGVITSLDELVGTVTKGKFKSLNSFLDDMLIPSIDKMTASIKDWIKAHPDEIVDFFKQFKDIDIASLVKGFAEGVLAVAQLGGSIVSALSKINPSLLGKMLAFASPLGNALLVLGGALKGTRHIWGGIGAILLAVGRKLGAGGLVGKIMEIFGGKNPAKEIAAAPTMMNTLRNTFKSMQGTLTVAGNIAIPVATVWGSVKALKSIIHDFKDIGETVGEVDWNVASQSFGAFAAFIGTFALAGNVLGNNISAGVNTLFGEAILGAITTFATGIAALDMRLIKDSFKSFRDITQFLVDGTENLGNLKKFNKEKATGRIKNLLGAVSEVYKALKEPDENGNTLMTATDTEVNKMGKITSGMGKILKDMPEISATLQELQGANLIGEKDAKAVGEKVSGMLNGLNEAFTSFLGQDFGKNPDELTAQMKGTIENFSGALNAITGKKGLLASMKKLLNDTRDIPGVESTASVLSRVKTFLRGEDGKGGLFKELADITKSQGDVSATDTFKTKMQNLSAGFKSVKSIFKKLKDIESTGLATQGKDATSNFTAVTMLQGLINQLNSVLGSSTFNNLQSNMTDFTASITELLDAISQLSVEQEISVEFSLKGGDVKGYKTVVKKIEDAVAKIKAAEKTIPTSIYRSIPVTITANVDVSGAISKIKGGADLVRQTAEGAMTKVNAQNGGTVYRAGGGSIFKPRGTDIVPAMLTPGEFVHNKKAVDYFGIDFMKRINALDVKGAVRALMNRGGMATTNLNRQNVVNNTINNNQRVTQNINTNNPNMAKMSIGRFAGAF